MSIICLGYSQKPGLERLLEQKFSAEPGKHGRWVYEAGKGDIKPVNAPLITSRYPRSKVYQVKLTNYSGNEAKAAVCVVMHDTVKNKITLVEHISYSGLSKPFRKQFLTQKFESKEQLTAFIQELSAVMLRGPAYKFELTNYSDSEVSYSLTNGADGSTTTSTVRYKRRLLWTNAQYTIRDAAVSLITDVNPVIGTAEGVR